MDKYYYLTDNTQQMGPVAPEDFKAYGITADTYIWREGMPDWIKVSQVPSLMQYIETPVSATTNQYVNTPPPSNLVWAILSTILCCLPTGIYAIIRACRVESLWREGRYNEAQKASNDAKLWSIIGAGVGLAVSILYAILIAFVQL